MQVVAQPMAGGTECVHTQLNIACFFFIKGIS